MVILGLDIGSKRIGIAKSDELGLLAHTLTTVNRTTDEHAVREIITIINEYSPVKIIVGLPKKLDGKSMEAVTAVEAFITVIKEYVTVPIETFDERLTTKQASRYLSETKTKGNRKKNKIDQLAAQIILQDYLDTTRK